jgi:tetratricopeptide (TPR) repeat protein
MTDKNSSPESTEAAASAVDLQEGIGASAAGVDALGVAGLALNASALDPAVARELGGFLHEQRELASRQRIVADKQSALLDHRLERVGLEKEHIEAQNHHLHLQRIHDKLRLVFDAGLACFGVALALLLVWAVWTATRSKSVVVEAFTVPPSFEARGLSGSVVAAQFLDRLQEIQRRGAVNPTDTTPIEDAWTHEIRVELPETGISLGDIQKFLRSWFGHDVRIGGAVVEDGDALVLTVRGNGVPAQRVAGKAGELDTLIASAAERALGAARPRELLGYLESTSRHAEAAALAPLMLASATSTEAPQILNMWGNALTGLGRWDEALDRYREANRLSPDAAPSELNGPKLNETIALERLGREEEAYETMMPTESSTHGTSSAAVHKRAWFNTAMIELRRDAPDLHDSLLAYARLTGSTHLLYEMLIASQDAIALASMHDIAGTELALTQADHGAVGPVDRIAAQQARSAIAHELGHDSEALADAQTALSLEERAPEWMLLFPPSACAAARYAEGAGLPNVADAVLAKAGTFVDCASAKAEIAAHRGAWDDAQRDFAAAVNLAPSLPMAYESWGEALAARNELAPAIEKYRAAHERGPHWADPVERWGEALAAQGQFQAAAQKYAEADTDAPKWGALHLHWGEALDKLGRRPEALKQYRAALELALSDSDKLLAAHYVVMGSR